MYKQPDLLMKIHSNIITNGDEDKACRYAAAYSETICVLCHQVSYSFALLNCGAGYNKITNYLHLPYYEDNCYRIIWNFYTSK